MKKPKHPHDGTTYVVEQYRTDLKFWQPVICAMASDPAKARAMAAAYSASFPDQSVRVRKYRRA